jgi:hypothetical protein
MAIEILNKIGRRRTYDVFIYDNAIKTKKVEGWIIDNTSVIFVGNRFVIGTHTDILGRLGARKLRGFDLLEKLASKYPRISDMLAEPFDHDSD